MKPCNGWYVIQKLEDDDYFADRILFWQTDSAKRIVAVVIIKETDGTIMRVAKWAGLAYWPNYDKASADVMEGSGDTPWVINYPMPDPIEDC